MYSIGGVARMARMARMARVAQQLAVVMLCDNKTKMKVKWVRMRGEMQLTQVFYFSAKTGGKILRACPQQFAR